MSSERQAEANRRNALQSTGPKTGEGIEAVRFNALRHGLRSLQTVIPGEAPEEWESHRAAVVEDLKPEGAVELALAEQIAVKLWRRAHSHREERVFDEKSEYLRGRQGVAIRKDAEEAASALNTSALDRRTGFAGHPAAGRS